jgi:hypothetical protein
VRKLPLVYELDGFALHPNGAQILAFLVDSHFHGVTWIFSVPLVITMISFKPCDFESLTKTTKKYLRTKAVVSLYIFSH